MEFFVFMRMFLGIQVFQNDDKSCPERHGGTNQTSLYIDSSEPSPGGGGMWKPDNTIRQVRVINIQTYRVFHLKKLVSTLCFGDFL